MRRERTSGTLSVLLGLTVAANAVVGPLVLGVMRLHESARMDTQLLGIAFVELVLAAPLAIVAGLLWRRGHAIAPVLGVASAGFSVYVAVQYVLAPDYPRYPGNNERFFILHLAIVLLGSAIVVRSLDELRDAHTLAFPRSLGRSLGVLLVVLNGVFAIAWLGSIGSVLTREPTMEYLEHPTAFWLIRLMDLGFLLPIGLIAGIGMFQRDPGGIRAGYAIVGVETLILCAVAAMAAWALSRGDSGTSLSVALLSTGATLVLATMWIRLIRAALRNSSLRPPPVFTHSRSMYTTLSH